jgi:hypothetical protein
MPGECDRGSTFLLNILKGIFQGSFPELKSPMGFQFIIILFSILQGTV